MEKILIEITPYSYLDELETFDVRLLQKNSAKVLQIKYNHAKWSSLDKAYKDEVYKIRKRKLTVEQQKELVIQWVEKIKLAQPDCFSVIGWYDLQVAIVRKEFGSG